MNLDEVKLNIIINHFGKHLQWLKLGEESGEVYKAICRYEYGVVDHTKEILEEIADLQVILEQLKVMYNLNEEDIQYQMEYKVDRTINRINERENTSKI